MNIDKQVLDGALYTNCIALAIVFSWGEYVVVPAWGPTSQVQSQLRSHGHEHRPLDDGGPEFSELLKAPQQRPSRSYPAQEGTGGRAT